MRAAYSSNNPSNPSGRWASGNGPQRDSQASTPLRTRSMRARRAAGSGTLAFLVSPPRRFATTHDAGLPPIFNSSGGLHDKCLKLLRIPNNVLIIRLQRRVSRERDRVAALGGAWRRNGPARTSETPLFSHLDTKRVEGQASAAQGHVRDSYN